MDALVALQDEGSKVLCVIRPEEWPELLDVRAALEARNLAWVTAAYFDYPVRGYLLRTAVTGPVAYLKGNLALKRIARDFSATHIHTANAAHVAAFWGAIRSLEMPLVYRAEDRPIRHNFFWRALWKFIVQRTTVFVANSWYIKRELASSGADESRITVLYAPPPRRTNPPPVKIPESSHQSGAIRFVYVGQIIPDKGVDVLIAAFQQIAQVNRDAHLLIAGRISDWSGDDWARALRDRTKLDLDYGNRVHFLGLVEDAPELIRRSHVHVAPSIKEEPYGLVVVEAKSTGRPSIIFRSGGMAELVEDGVDGAVVSEKSVAGLAAAMIPYATRPDLAELHGRAALASMDKLNFDSYSKSWREIYERAATEFHPRSPVQE